MIEQFFSTELGLAVYGVLVATAADLLFGVIAALRDGSFQLDALAAVLRKHVLGRVAPIFGMLLFGHIGNQPLLLAAGLTGAALYVAETFGSIMDSFGDIAGNKGEETEVVVESNPVPEE